MMNTPICLRMLFYSHMINALFSPDFTDYDAYGIKIAANSLIFMEAKNQDKTYFLKFAPYNYTNTSLQCALGYIDPTHYIYSVAVGSSQALTNQPYVYYAGAVASTNGVDGDKYGRKGTFIAILINRDNASVQSYIDSGKPMSCSKFSIPSILFLPTYGHQEYFVIAAEPTGKFAMGLATDFVFQYRPFSSSLMTNRSTSAVWPNNATFYPCAADATQWFTIVAGFVKNSLQSKARATPTVHVLRNSDLTVFTSWTYTAPDNSWQSYLTYSGLDSWNKKFTMSVKINGDDPTRVLIGMPFLNTVFLFRVTNNGTNLSMTDSVSYEKSVGFGKSVTWLSSTRVAILYAAYSLDYSTWQSSKVHVFDWSNDTNLSKSPIAVIPNAQQPLPSTINSELIRVMSTPTDLGILDRAGGVHAHTVGATRLVSVDSHEELKSEHYARYQSVDTVHCWHIQSRHRYSSLQSLPSWIAKPRHRRCRHSMHQLLGRRLLSVGSCLRGGQCLLDIAVASLSLSSIARTDRL